MDGILYIDIINSLSALTLPLSSLHFLIFGIKFLLTEILEQPGGGFSALNDKKDTGGRSHSPDLMRGLDHVIAQCFASKNELQQE